MKNMFKSRNSMWVKYSDYEILHSKQGDFLVPKENATFSVYDPVAVSEQLVSDAVNAGCEIKYGQNDIEAIKLSVIDFVKKYGLFGFLTSLPMDREFYFEEETFLGSNSVFFNSEAANMPTNEYVAYFLPFAANKLIRKETKIAFTVGREDIYETMFCKEYGEPFNWIAGILLNFYQHFVSVLQNPDENFSEEELKRMREDCGSFENSGISFYISSKKRPEMKWEFDSLKTVLETAYCMYIGDERDPLRICKHCGKAYYSSNTRSEFCSPRCRNQWNVYKCRNRSQNE